MNKENKTAKSFRLSSSTIKELESLAKRHGISQTDVITILIHCNYMGFDEDATNDWFDMAARM